MSTWRYVASPPAEQPVRWTSVAFAKPKSLLSARSVSKRISRPRKKMGETAPPGTGSGSSSAPEKELPSQYFLRAQRASCEDASISVRGLENRRNLTHMYTLLNEQKVGFIEQSEDVMPPTSPG